MDISIDQYEQLMRAHVAGFRFGKQLANTGPWDEVRLCKCLAKSKEFANSLPPAVEADPGEQAKQNARCFAVGVRGVLLALRMAKAIKLA